MQTKNYKTENPVTKRSRIFHFISISIKKGTLSLFLFMFYAPVGHAQKATLYGQVKDSVTNQKMPYVYIIVPGTSIGTNTDANGYYSLPLSKGTYKVQIRYLAYELKEYEVNVEQDSSLLNISLKPLSNTLKGVMVLVSRKTGTDEAVLNEIKETHNIASGISNQQIAKSQDKDASEVIKRIPGITIIDNRFVIIRGLSQRYNNVWLNDAATPSSESDYRAFSFDFIPSTMIDHIMVYKNSAPELPADFAGGFVKIETKETADQNLVTVGYQTAFRTHSTFGQMNSQSPKGRDFLGFGAFSRSIPNDFPANLNRVSLDKTCGYALTLNNDWNRKKRIAIPDQGLSFSLSHRNELKKLTVSQIANVSYSYANTILCLQNSNYGIYDIENRESSYNKHYVDTQFVVDSKLGAAYNISFYKQNGMKIRFKNLFQNHGKERTSLREGTNYSNGYIERSQEFYHKNSMTYTTQLEGDHILKKDTALLNWSAGYALTHTIEPDRRIMDARLDQNPGSPYYLQYKSMDNDIRRYFQTLNEHTASLLLDYEHRFFWNTFTPILRAGIYNEYKTRFFDARNFTYKKSMNYDLPEGYFYFPYEQMFEEQYMRPDGFYLVENTGKSDSYTSSNLINAGYLSVNIPFFGFALYGGLRVEHQYLLLDSYESDGVKPVHLDEKNFDLFPAVNLSYTIKKKHIVRFAYGKTINRPEFREIAPYVYYDFESFSNYEGNPDLKNAIIHNFDLRYEWYPTNKEMISFGIFYKAFANSIENTYFYAGGQLQYSYMNASSAQSFGLELDIRKSLEVLKLKGLHWVLNVSLIKSNVIFPENSVELSRPMQGQSPYIVNTGLYYDLAKHGFSCSLLYNVIGKRIVAVGEVNQNANENIPDTYEMPFHALDFFAQKKIGKRVAVKLGVKNILSQRIIFRQFGTARTGNEVIRYTQDTKVLRTGVQISAGVTVDLN